MNWELEKLSKFRQIFSPISLQYRKPERSYDHPRVFWRESEGSENNSCSADILDTPIIHDKIKSALSNLSCWGWFISQFWAPVTIGGRRLLSTSAQPFAVSRLSKELAKYRINSDKYKYNIDANKLDIEPEKMIISGGPATAFLNRRTSITKLQGFLSESDDYGGLNLTLMIPICFPSQSDCIGVLELTFDHSEYQLASLFFNAVKAIQHAGLDVLYVQHLIPYKTINGLKLVKDEIEKALKVVCASHNLALAQVWIAYEDKINVPLSYSFEDGQTKRLLAIKLTGYFCAVAEGDYDDFEPYFRFCDATPRVVGEDLLLVSLQDYESRYISKLCADMFVDWDDKFRHSAFAICLKSNCTADFNYAFEFIWTKHSDYVILLEALLLTLKRCLPRFKFASGAELDDELNVIDVETSTEDITEKFKIFQGKRSSLMPEAREEGKKTLVVDNIAPSKVTCKTTPKALRREDIEKQFGRNLKDAAKNLNVSVSTLKRKSRKFGIQEWPGANFVKRKANDSSIIQTSANEDDNGANQEPSTIDITQNSLTIKAELADDMIKFCLPVSQANFFIVQNEIGLKFNLSHGTYKLKYRDEFGDWILLRSDEEMSYCIASSRKSYPNEVRLRVIPSTQPSGPSCSNRIRST